MSRRGTVSLVGAGPGDPELITVRGLSCLRRADVVVYDRLVHPDLLDAVPARAERVFVGKARGVAAMTQRAIEEVLIQRALAGRYVVRLKGGDPFVFGRGGEEVEALAAAGIPYEVVPGITSAVAVPAAAGIPVTHRELSSAVTIVTGHEDPDKGEPSIDWPWLASGSGTLVILMGLNRLPAICSELMRYGREPDTPAAVVASGTLPQQRVVSAPLYALADTVARTDVRSPAVVVIGECAAFPERVSSLGQVALAQAV